MTMRAVVLELGLVFRSFRLTSNLITSSPNTISRLTSQGMFIALITIRNIVVRCIIGMFTGCIHDIA